MMILMLLFRKRRRILGSFSKLLLFYRQVLLFKNMMFNVNAKTTNLAFTSKLDWKLFYSLKKFKCIAQLEVSLWYAILAKLCFRINYSVYTRNNLIFYFYLRYRYSRYTLEVCWEKSIWFGLVLWQYQPNIFLYIKTVQFNISIVFVYTKIDVKTVPFQTIQFSISTPFSSIWPIDRNHRQSDNFFWHWNWVFMLNWNFWNRTVLTFNCV